MASKAAEPSRRMSADEKKWRAQNDAETLARAQEIQADKSRHGAAKAHATKEAARYARIAKKVVK